MNKVKSIESTKLPFENHYETCLAFAEKFVRIKRSKFTSEDVKESYLKSGLPVPFEPRVWGAVFSKLLKDNKILHVGYVRYRSKLGHQRPSSLWAKN